MRTLGILAGILLIVLFGNAAFSMDQKAVDDLIKKMDKAVDPHDLKKNIKTQLAKIETTIPAQKIKMNITAYNKFPNKSRIVSEIPGVMKSIRVCDGEKYWEYSLAMGLREIKGKELNNIKFQADKDNPKSKMRDVFSDIKVPDKTVKVGEFNCYELTCVPKKKYNSKNIKMYVDNKDFLLRKVEMISETQMGPIKIEMLNNDYKQVDKIMVPMVITVKQLGMEMVMKVTEFKNNVKLDDSLFEKPTPEKAAPKAKKLKN